MANLHETSTWEAGIYQLETSDPVMGGENGIDNLAPRQLANRTLWLKNEIAKAVQSIGANKAAADNALAGKADKNTSINTGAGLTGGGNLSGSRTIALANPSTLSGSTNNWPGNGSTGHTHELAKATATQAGVVKLVDNLTSGGIDAALTAEQGKQLKRELDSLHTSSVMLNGDQGIHGNKTFYNGISVSNGQKYTLISVGSNDTFLWNTRSNKYLQLKDSGELQYSGVNILLANNMTDAINSNDSHQVASARAVKTAYDKANSAQDTATQAAPPGTIAYFAAQNPPHGWLAANGATLSRSSYAALFAAIGTRFGAGNGSSTFQLPDLRGEFIRSWDNGHGVDIGRGLGTHQGDAIRNITGTHRITAEYDNDYTTGVYGHTSAVSTGGSSVHRAATDSSRSANEVIIFDASAVVPTANENRPRNVALLAMIKI